MLCCDMNFVYIKDVQKLLGVMNVFLRFCSELFGYEFVFFIRIYYSMLKYVFVLVKM